MIISHEHRYVFIEVPQTGSWAIRDELCSYYSGTPILHKHAAYFEFRSIATHDEKSYFAFATVRNPLDTVVSRYCKLKTDHKQVFSDSGSTGALISDFSDRKKFEFIRNTDASFEAFFATYHKRSFSDMVDLSSGDLDFVIRFENLQQDFAEILRRLKIEQVRPVPVTNKTEGKRADWESYYTPGTIAQAKRVFGPFMKEWGYDFPPAWGDYHVSWLDQAEFRFVRRLRNAYLGRFRYNDRAYARPVRWLRANLIK